MTREGTRRVRGCEGVRATQRRMLERASSSYEPHQNHRAHARCPFHGQRS